MDEKQRNQIEQMLSGVGATVLPNGAIQSILSDSRRASQLEAENKSVRDWLSKNSPFFTDPVDALEMQNQAVKELREEAESLRQDKARLDLLHQNADSYVDTDTDYGKRYFVIRFACPESVTNSTLIRQAIDAALTPSTSVSGGQLARPQIVCIVGSSRFVDVAAVKAWEFAKRGILALGLHYLPPYYAEQTGKTEDHHFAEQENVASILDELHLRKIDMADRIFVVNQGGYIGDRTRIEIAYATERGKPIEYLQPPKPIGHGYVRLNEFNQSPVPGGRPCIWSDNGSGRVETGCGKMYDSTFSPARYKAYKFCCHCGSRIRTASVEPPSNGLEGGKEENL